MKVAVAQRLSDRPLAVKLVWLLLLCGGITALVSSLAVLAIGWRAAEKQAEVKALEVATLLAHALEAPVAFEDAKGIDDSLNALGARRDVRGAWVWHASGRLLASRGEGTPLAAGTRRGGLWDGLLDYSQPIGAGASVQPAGHVTIRLDLAEYREGLLAQSTALLAAVGLGVLLSIALSQWFARRIAQPIVELADAAGAIADGHDYTRRLPDTGRDEVGRAVSAFNAMIDEVRSRDEALERANRGLEDRVAERTAELEQEKLRVEAASRAKTRFLANMSHELRTPLNGVIGAAQLLRDQGDEAMRRHELTDIIRTSGTNLLGLIDGVLDLARIESGTLELRGGDFNLVETVEAVAATAGVNARQKGLRLACIIDPAVAPWRHGDEQRLRQVLLNLVGNAIKFTLHGEVVLRVDDDPAKAGGLRIAIVDTGIGMNEATLRTVFEPFRQGEDGSARRFGGTGLGLAICREVVDLMGGRIAVESIVQRGSTFTLRLPLPAASRPGRSPEPLAWRIAYVEPHEASAEALEALLLRIGCAPIRCTSAAEVREAIGIADALGRPPWLLAATDDAATADMLEGLAQDIDAQRVIGMHRSEWFAADAARDTFGITRSVVKPVLRAALVSRLGGIASSAAALDTSPGSLTGSGRVLVVEDDMVNQTIVASILAQAGFSVEVAGDGYTALQTFGEMRFDLVLMDWQMPDMDGLEVTRRLRAGAAGVRGRTTPIVALTANAFAEDRVACLEAGMNDFLTKPVVAEALVRTVNRWIGLQVPAVATTIAADAGFHATRH